MDRARMVFLKKAQTPPQKITATAPPSQKVRPVARIPTPNMLKSSAPRHAVPYPAMSRPTGKVDVSWLLLG